MRVRRFGSITVCGVDDGREPAVLASADPGLVLAVEAAAAAAGRRLDHVDEVPAIAPRWRHAPVMLVGSDMATEVVRLGLPARDSVYLVAGPQTAPAEYAASVPLGAEVVMVSDSDGWLAHVLSGSLTHHRRQTVAVVGGSGGVGASTFAAALAAAGRGLGRAALVDLDPIGGGADLLVGVEQQSGPRWGLLRAARGQLSDLGDQLPHVEGVSVVSMDRAGETAAARDAVTAVLAGLRRSHAWVVVDVGRGLDAGAREALRTADHIVLLAGNQVRAVAAARMTMVDVAVPVTGVVVRQHRGATVSSHDVSTALGLPVITGLPDDSGLAGAADQGIPPWRAGSRRWRHACGAAFAAVAPPGGAS